MEQIYNILQEKYIGEIDDEALIDAAAKAMVAATGDQWSAYRTPQEYLADQEAVSNSYVGIGVSINASTPENGFQVTRVEPESGAATAGIKVDDWIIKVGDEETYDLSLSQLKELVRGKVGTAVDITVNRSGQIIEFVVPRGTIAYAVAEGELLPGNIGLVRIYNFDDRCATESIAAIEELKNQGAQALIFDVRNNPGGYKRELVALLDYLLPEGDLFHSETYDGAKEVDRSDANCLQMPMAVLMNGNSYSAAEFFAAALVEYNWAFSVGEPTTGKGYFQGDIELNDGSAVHLSVGKYRTPNGVSLAETKGIVPAYELKLTEQQSKALLAGTLKADNDPQIKKAVDELLKKMK